MTVEEFDIRFDILYNNLASNAAPALNAYEKSVFLSQAQRDIIIELYNGRNVSGISFESTEEARAYLRNLNRIKTIDTFQSDKESYTDCIKHAIPLYTENEKKEFSEVLFITKEEVRFNTDDVCLKSKIPIVTPVKQDCLLKILKNPFKKPSDNTVLRVDDADSGGSTISIYSKYPIKDYRLYYVKIPSPIILKGIEGTNLSIDGILIEDSKELKIKSEGLIGSCPEILHQVILERAVALAKQAYIGQ